jgi:FkbM family methyltransferase
MMFDLSPLQLPDNATVIDCGANEGQFLDCLLAQVKSPRVISIEMLPDVARKCQETHPGVTVLNCAVGMYTGWTEFHRYSFTPMSSLLPIAPLCTYHYPDHHCQDAGEWPVRVFTLDDLSHLLMVDKVDLLKLDLQGGELLALNGAEEVLPVTQNVIVEVEFLELYYGQALADEVDQHLATFGFRLRAELEQHIRTGGVKAAADRWYSR